MLRRIHRRNSLRIQSILAISAISFSTLGCTATARSTRSSSTRLDHSTAAVSTELRQALQQRIDQFREQLNAPGATAAIILPAGDMIALATGVSHKPSATPMQPNDRMLAGSTGKTFVAATLLQLLEEGRVDLDAKIATWLNDEPWFARLPNAGDITLRMLLNHTSGLPDHVNVNGFADAIEAQPEKHWQPPELLAFILDTPALFPAGQGWSYADTNYTLVGMIIERVTGKTFYGEARRRFLEPLALDDTIPSDRQVLPGLISGYTSPDNPFPVPEEVTTNNRCAINPQGEWTGGGFVSTSPDLACWSCALYGGDILKPATKGIMLDGVKTGRWEDTDYGLGVMIRRTKLGPAHGHGGWFPGYITGMSYYPEHDLAVAVQVNTDIEISSVKLYGLLDDLAAIALDSIQ